jgi:phosphoribosylamine--glycine ligase
VLREVARPTIAEMAHRGTPFAGLLYVGLAMTSRGARVIEFNARFGDPETQVVLALLETPLAGLLQAAAVGTLASHPPLQWRDGSAVTVVIAAANYPETPRTGDVITGSEQPGVIHAGTRRRADGAVVSTGGRVLSATAIAATLREAREAAYALVDSIDLPGGQHRSDIALKAEIGQITV